MEQLHAHEVLHMMEGNSYSESSLRKAIVDKFGECQHFYACSADDMNVDELIEFLKKKGKFISSPGRPPRPYVFGAGISTLLWMGSPIRRPPGRWMCAPRRGLSQLAASFIGSLCQGIRRAPVVSCGTAPGPRDIHVSLMKINRYHE